MSVKMMDFEDLPEEEVKEREAPKVSLTLKIPAETRDMFNKIAHRERRNMGELATIVIEDYINDYVEKYEASQK